MERADAQQHVLESVVIAADHMTTAADRIAAERLKALDGQHQIDQGLAVAFQFMNPEIGLRRRDARWLAVASVFDADIAAALPDVALTFKLDLLDLGVFENLGQATLVDQRLTELQIEFSIAVERDFVVVVGHVRRTSASRARRTRD